MIDDPELSDHQKTLILEVLYAVSDADNKWEPWETAYPALGEVLGIPRDAWEYTQDDTFLFMFLNTIRAIPELAALAPDEVQERWDT
jgi:hypothetical protein